MCTMGTKMACFSNTVDAKQDYRLTKDAHQDRHSSHLSPMKDRPTSSAFVSVSFGLSLFGCAL